MKYTSDKLSQKNYFFFEYQVSGERPPFIPIRQEHAVSQRDAYIDTNANIIYSKAFNVPDILSKKNKQQVDVASKFTGDNF